MKKECNQWFRSSLRLSPVTVSLALERLTGSQQISHTFNLGSKK